MATTTAILDPCAHLLPSASRALNLPDQDKPVLGVDLKCSESCPASEARSLPERWPALSLAGASSGVQGHQLAQRGSLSAAPFNRELHGHQEDQGPYFACRAVAVLRKRRLGCGSLRYSVRSSLRSARWPLLAQQAQGTGGEHRFPTGMEHVFIVLLSRRSSRRLTTGMLRLRSVPQHLWAEG
jgi:hypothetical protein